MRLRGQGKHRNLWKAAVNSLGNDRRSLPILVKVNQADVRGQTPQRLKDSILIRGATVVCESSLQLDQPRRTGKQTQKAPHLFVHAHANHGNRLTEVKGFSAGRACEIVGGHLGPFAPASCFFAPEWFPGSGGSQGKRSAYRSSPLRRS